MNGAAKASAYSAFQASTIGPCMARMACALRARPPLCLLPTQSGTLDGEHDKISGSLVRCGRTCGAAQRDHLGATKSNFPTPPVEVPTREIKRVAKLDKHIERRHQTKCVASSF